MRCFWTMLAMAGDRTAKCARKRYEKHRFAAVEILSTDACRPYNLPRIDAIQTAQRPNMHTMRLLDFDGRRTATTLQPTDTGTAVHSAADAWDAM